MGWSTTQWRAYQGVSKPLSFPFPITEDGRTYPRSFQDSFRVTTREMGKTRWPGESWAAHAYTFWSLCLNNVQATPNTAFFLPPSPQVNLQETPMFLGELGWIISQHSLLCLQAGKEHCLIGLYFLPVRISFLGHLHLNEEIKRGHRLYILFTINSQVINIVSWLLCSFHLWGGLRA